MEEIDDIKWRFSLLQKEVIILSLNIKELTGTINNISASLKELKEKIDAKPE